MNILSNFSNKEISFLTYIIVINIVTFVIFGVDKAKAKNGSSRISEAVFLILSLVGGATGALLGMVMFRHKTNKLLFTIGIPVLFLINQIVELLIVNMLR